MPPVAVLSVKLVLLRVKEPLRTKIPPPNPAPPPPLKLPPRPPPKPPPPPQEVLALLALGLSNEAIAQRMKLSPSTIRHHVSQVLNKLGVTNRTEAATTAVRVGCV
ncbi:MAG: LuxR C-terminal-related transcriptional regulator [Nostoc sp.]|uniref:response regulator transcription factor n=1 Tax=Nostoc sp. TaxID=1180 RepID=UPI002FFA6326